MGNESGFVEFARWMRAKPAFDAEERDYRLTLADAVRGLIGAARGGHPLGEHAHAVARRHLASLDPVLPPRQVALLADWAARSEQDLREALRCFSDAGEDASDQVARFVEAVDASPVPDRFRACGLPLGSLLAFGTSPEARPIMSAGRVERLQQLLGEEPAPASDVRDQYRANLGFAQRIQAAFEEAGIPVRDM